MIWRLRTKDPETKKERVIEIDYTLRGRFTSGTEWDPPEEPEVIIKAVYDEKGDLVPEEKWNEIGFTEDEYEEFVEAALEMARMEWEEWLQKGSEELDERRSEPRKYGETVFWRLQAKDPKTGEERAIKIDYELKGRFARGTEWDPPEEPEVIIKAVYDEEGNFIPEERWNVIGFTGKEQERFVDAVLEKVMDKREKGELEDYFIESSRFLAGLPSKTKRVGKEEDGESRKILKDWYRLAVGKGGLTEETSELSGDVVPPGFTFPDPLAFYGYAAQKLPLTLKRALGRMPEKERGEAEKVLKDLADLSEAADRMVDVFAELADRVDKYDAGSIEGREVARVFRYLMDAARFVQGGTEVAGMVLEAED